MDSFDKPPRHTRRNALIGAAISTLAALMSACSYGDPCLRTTDCGSGLICDEGKCIVDPGDNFSDGAPPTDVVSMDASTSDSAGRDSTVTPDTASETSAPVDSSADSASEPPVDARDGNHDGTSDGDSASLDARSTDAPDARASTDASGDASGGDVGNDADGGIARDVLTDAMDAAG